ncbi:serine hydrolase [Maricurvus nonylphenolicus]|uniref:serine hydrolase domain-containing protein n=1 Tax=Maricurvus nonylphenolicus TaxID=1008307 RepID=UPI0036F1DC7A
MRFTSHKQLGSLKALCMAGVLALGAQPTMAEPTIMEGFPPTAESQVTLKNYRDYPYNRWSFHNLGAIANTLMIPRAGAIQSLTEANNPTLGQLQVTDGYGKQRSVDQILDSEDTDAFVVLQGDKLLMERYFNGMSRYDQHIWFSATKSLTTTALGILVEQGKIDLNASPVNYIPELKGSGFERVTIQEVLDHSTAIDFKENYTDLTSDFFQHYAPAMKMAFLPGAQDVQPGDTEIYGIYDFLARFIKPDTTLEPNQAFDYNSANADLAGWLISRVSGMPYHQFIQQHIWSKLGTEHDAYIAADRALMAIATGGMNTTARDAARFGRMILNRGQVNGEQVIPANWVDTSLAITDHDKAKMKANTKYKDNSWIAYKNMWWIIDENQGEYAAVGIHGQVIYINRAANVVIAYFSSQPTASAARNPQFQSKLFAAQAIARHLQSASSASTK